MQETVHQSVFHILGEYKGVLRAILHTPQTLYLAAILLVMQITWTISGSFWSIIVTQKLGLPEQYLAIFPFIKSSILLAFFFAVNPLINRINFRTPLVLGFLGYVVSQLLLVLTPVQGYAVLVVSVFVEACSYAMVAPLVDKLTVLTIDAKERARIQSIVFMFIILITAPFGWIAGTLSEVDKALPFLLNIALYLVGAGLAYIIGSQFQERSDTRV
jgi:MFS family permease